MLAVIPREIPDERRDRIYTADDVEPADTRPAGQLRLIDDPRGRVPVLERHPADVLLRPLVQIEPAERVLPGRQVRRLPGLRPQKRFGDRDSQTRMRGLPHLRIRPVLILAGAPPAEEERRIPQNPR